jgi:hypothetical protein
MSAIPSCIYQAARYLPLEKIYGLTHPTLTSPAVEDKRTWRGGIRPSGHQQETKWTTMDLLTAFAGSKGWVTAKAGRPDVHRAGNASTLIVNRTTYADVSFEVLRALAEGRIGWAFWPPHTAIPTITAHAESDSGIWAPHITIKDENSEFGSDEEVEQVEVVSDDDDASESDESSLGDVDPSTSSVGIGRFGALLLDDYSGDEDL